MQQISPNFIGDERRSVELRERIVREERQIKLVLLDKVD